MDMDQRANQDFERAFLRAFWRKIVNWTRRQNNELLPYDLVRENLPIHGQHYLGMRQVPINEIVGSMGRYHDFDRAFLPTQSRTKDRWVRIDKAHYSSVALPPVELFKIGEVYFVKDGNHRVSVARERGQEFVDAYVTEIDIPVRLTPDIKVDDLVLKKEQAEFLVHSDLASIRPLAQIQTTLPGLYERFMEHIQVHRWYLGEKNRREFSIGEAAASWYDRVYQPVVQLIHENELLKDFPGSSEADLFLWMMAFEDHLRNSYREEIDDEGAARTAAAQSLIQDYPLPAVRKLVKILSNSKRIDELILQQERAIFLEETRLSDLRPDHTVEITLPGKYDDLREHIAVHRWYLGEQHNQEASYPEAVASWYDHVYQPLVEIIREQAILGEFKGRTETDLYLWVIDHQGYLQDQYGSQVPLDKAAEEFAEHQRKIKPKQSD